MQHLRAQSKAMNCVAKDTNLTMEEWELEISGTVLITKFPTCGPAASRVHWSPGRRPVVLPPRSHACMALLRACSVSTSLHCIDV